MDSFIVLIVILNISIVLFFVFLLGMAIKGMFIDKNKVSDDKSWYLRIAFSPEHFFSDIFLTISVALFFGFLFAINRSLGSHFEVVTLVGVSLLVAYGVGYKLKALYPIVIASLGTFVWWGMQIDIWTQEVVGKNVTQMIADDQAREVVVVSGFILLGLISYSVGLIAQSSISWKRFGVWLNSLGIFTIVGIFLILSTRAGFELMNEMLDGNLLFAGWKVTTLFGITAFAALASFIMAIKQQAIYTKELLALLGIFLFVGLITFMPETDFGQYNYSLDYRSGAWAFTAFGSFWAIFMNIVTFLMLVGVVMTGYIRKETWYINLGAFMLFIFIIIKYFDWFFEFLDKSLFFLLAGLLMLGLGYGLERGRKYMLSQIKK